ncbi:hypothetical protein H2198_002197 [Neophaeococcomyces mojaviensis]|uniref:Uncharacterized protein n=1 Tax=Neophaeococcomyces mojaviensis TaxID=3383035 RepID=A0ACC3AEX7_9EURO|nr:hypothetical protein H2198_002197 [Knufia sp. JES_112]
MNRSSYLDSDDGVNQSIYNNPKAMFRMLGAGQPGGLPMPEITTAGEVRREAKSYSTKIFDSFHLLGSILDRHEETIQKRWTKKTRNQRLNILLKAWPDMAISHRPDFAAFRRESEVQRDRGSKCRDAYLFPYINAEDLSKPKTLPLFLHARSRHQPCEFSFSDLGACRFGKISKAIVPKFLNGHVMLFRGRTTADTYGQLLNWDDHPDAFDWMNERIGTLPGEGLLILEIQHRVLDFLVRCCKTILHDLDSERLASDNYPLQLNFEPLSENDIEGFSSLSIMAIEAPYRAPSSLNWRRLESLLAAKKTATEDHIWSLREDPSYFVDCVLEYKEHRQELLKDSHGQPHPVFEYRQDNVFWGRVLGNIITSAYLSLEIWSELQSQAARLIELEQKHRLNIRQDASLPDEYLDAILRFEHYLNQAAKGPLGLLKHSVVASPAFRPFFERTPPPDIHTPKIHVRQKGTFKVDKPVQNLKWLLRILWEDDNELFLVGMTDTVDELQRLLESEPKANEFISAFLAGVVGDLSIICECLRQVNTYQPWAANFENAVLDRKGDITKQFAERMASAGAMMSALKAIDGISRYGNPEDGKFRYPIDKRRTKENVEQLLSAERNLDVFWDKVDPITSRSRGFKELAVGKLLGQERILRRTTQWIEPAKQEGPAFEQIDELCKPLSELYYNIEKRTGHKQERCETPKQKQKVKTRGTSTVDATTAASEPTVVQDTINTLPTFALDSRALKVFHTLFYTPSLTATPGEVSWTDFIHALTSTGFSSEKLYGSVWQFSPTKLDIQRSIQFHEPHPSSKVPYRTVRRFGRRLNRAYGWDGRMFVLAEKK